VIRSRIARIHALDAGILFMLFSALLSALNGAIAKSLGAEMSALEIVFWRNLAGMAMILLALRHTPPSLPGGHPVLLLSRGLLGFSAMILFFYTITTIPLGEAITLNKTSPLFVTLLAFFLMGERLGPWGVLALFLGFLGVVFITQPWGLTVSRSHLMGLLGGFLAACAYATIKRLRHLYDARMIVLSFTAMGTAIPLLLFAVSGHWEAPEPLAFLFPPFQWPQRVETWGSLGLLALTATLSQWLLTKAYTQGRAGIVGVVSYGNIPFAIGFGVALGDPLPDRWVWMGIALIVGAGLLLKKG
jgi:drug/metabolite transporter (DMT)-like permease